jgi:hypothetical protein
VSRFDVTQEERAGWQRRAAAELLTILDAHRDLPVIAWTVAAAGSALVWHVPALGPGASVQDRFDSWRVALMLTESSHNPPHGDAAHLSASKRRNGVRLTLFATILDIDGDVR